MCGVLTFSENLYIFSWLNECIHLWTWDRWHCLHFVGEETNPKGFDLPRSCHTEVEPRPPRSKPQIPFMNEPWWRAGVCLNPTSSLSRLCDLGPLLIFRASVFSCVMWGDCQKDSLSIVAKRGALTLWHPLIELILLLFSQFRCWLDSLAYLLQPHGMWYLKLQAHNPPSVEGRMLVQVSSRFHWTWPDFCGPGSYSPTGGLPWWGMRCSEGKRMSWG